MNDPRYRTEPQGLDRFAKFDPSDVRMRQANYQHVPGWFGAYTWALRHGDYEAAEIIKEAQFAVPHLDETDEQYEKRNHLPCNDPRCCSEG